MSKTDGMDEIMGFLLDRADQERDNDKKLEGRKVSKVMARDAIFLEELHKTLKSVFPRGPVKAVKHAPNQKRRKEKKPRIVNLAFSDLHYHSLLDPRELPFEYGPVEEARRTSKVITEAMEYKPQYRGDSELYCHVFGDIIQGDLHDPRDAATMTEQFGAALHLLTSGARNLASAYERVTYFCVPGNHGRNKRRHPERATSQKWDSFENMIYLALKYATASLPNVKVVIPYTPFYTFPAFDKTGFVTHGDTVLDVGFPSSTIDIKKIRNQVNEWNAGETNHDLFLVGHVHCGAMVQIPSGPVFMSNGPLIPPDGYAISRGTSHTNCGQWIWESVEGHIVGDARYIRVDSTTDKDESLDKVITPFHGFETESPVRK